MYGWKAMNVPFCAWLRWGCPVRPWVMFHEVAYPVAAGQRLRHNLLGVVNRWMANTVARAAEKIFVAVPSWSRLLRRIAPQHNPAVWLPVPSNVPTTVDPAAVRAVRDRLAPSPGTRLIGHFSTFGEGIVAPLLKVLPPLLLRESKRLALLIGRGGPAVAERLTRENPALNGRVSATGVLPGQGVAAHLAACDVLLQPYPDGASSRRTSLMAGLALGLPTTSGSATESVWEDEGLVRLVPVNDCSALLRAVEDLASDEGRQHQAERGKRGYEAHFSLRRVIEVLRGERSANEAMVTV
jgi:glycosyltransferase involved in cell wall biosynthesis